MKKIFISPILLLLIVASGIGQNTQTTKNTTDQRLRSTGRVNTSTLGMEFDLPLGGYQGRGFDLPLGLSYSSKLWKFEDQLYLPSMGNSPAMSFVDGIYSEDAAAGWTSSLARPYIEYTGMTRLFDGYGKPYHRNSQSIQPYQILYIRRITVFLPGGESHELRAADVPSSPMPSPTPGQPLVPPDTAWDGDFFATDGSGIRYFEHKDANPTNSVYRLYLPDGSFYDFNGGPLEPHGQNANVSYIRRANKLTDVNGNYVQYNAPDTQPGHDPYGSWTDQLGRPFPVMIPPETPLRPENESEIIDEFFLPGMASPYRIKWKRLDSEFAQANYSPRYIGLVGGSFPSPSPTPLFTAGVVFPSDSCGSTDLPEHPLNSELYVNISNHHSPDYSGPFNPMVLAEIELPNGASYRFKYNEYGEIERIEYPFGGHEEFDYKKVDSLAGQAKGYQQTNRGVENRRVYQSVGSAAMTYHYSAASSDTNYRTTVTAPDGIQTDTFMHRGIKPHCDSQLEYYEYGGLKWGYDSPLAGRTWETRIFSAPDASNNRHIVQRTVTTWTATTPNVVPPPSPQYPLPIRGLGSIKYMQWNARVAFTHSITYEGGSGVAAATGFEYGSADNRASPLNVTAKNEYGYVPVSAGGAYLPATDYTAPPTPAPTPAIGALLRRTETAYEGASAYTNRNILRLPTQALVKDGSGSIKAKSQTFYDETSTYPLDTSYSSIRWTNPQTSIRGLATTTKSWYDPNSSSAFIDTHAQYDQMGNLIKAWDARDKLTQTTYSSTYDYTFPTSVTSPVPDPSGSNGSDVAFVTSTAYDYNTGLPTSTTDANNQVTTISYRDPVTDVLDPLLRVRKVVAPNGQQTLTEFGQPDASGILNAANRFVKTSTQFEPDKWKQEYSWFDGLGRAAATQAVDPEAGDVWVLTAYDPAGRVRTVTNPYRGISNPVCGTNIGCTVTDYDAAGRVWKVTAPDSNAVITTYSVATSGGQIGNVETVTDEAGKAKRTIEDAFDNLIRVDEPDQNGALGDVSSPAQATVYTYDTSENLIQIVQGALVRNYYYDGLNRLTQAVNPESGTFQFSYDENGNLLTKTDARGISTTHTYDALNRVTLRDYSDATPDVSYYYDGDGIQNSKGRLTKVYSTVSETRFTSFDTTGNVLGSQQTTAGNAYPFSYTYNLGGDLATQTYPSEKIVVNEYGGNGDLSQVGKQTNGSPFIYANSFSYTPDGEIERLRFGNDTWETTDFNSRRQAKEIRLGHSATDASIWKTTYDYGEWNDTTLEPLKNNGSLARQTTVVPTISSVTGFTAIQDYTYDKLDRVRSATETINGGQTWKQTFLYDRFGNKNYDTTNSNTTTLGSCATAVCNPSVAATNKNQLSGYGYDLAGNITTDAEGRSITYDAENRQITATGIDLAASYAYDGNGKRVKSYNDDTQQTTIFVYDADGRLSAEYTINVPPPTVPTISYMTEDALGSPRVITNAFGDVKSRRDFFPFGEEIYAGYGSRNTNQEYSSSTDDTRVKFATYQRDAETGLDFAQSRYYSQKQGRFTSPDEFKGGPDELFDFEEDASSNPTFYADLGNPQSLNKYQYGYNNPYKFNDPTGHCPAIGIGIVVAACYFILSNPTPIGPRQRQSAGEAIGDVFGILPGGKYTGGLLGGILLKGGSKALKQPLKQAGKLFTQKTAKQAKVPVSQRVKSPTKKQREDVYNKNKQENGGKLKCAICGTGMERAKKDRRGVTPKPSSATVDHIKARSRGGTNDSGNLRGACRKCNRDKSDK